MTVDIWSYDHDHVPVQWSLELIRATRAWSGDQDLRLPLRHDLLQKSPLNLYELTRHPQQLESNCNYVLDFMNLTLGFLEFMRAIQGFNKLGKVI
jgi:hypothetical protein